MGLKLTAMQMIKRLFQSSSAFRPAALWGLAGIFCAGWSGPGLAADLIIEVEGVRNAEGLIRLALYDRAEDYPSKGKAIATEDVAAESGSMTFIIPGLAPGSYAIALFHDEDGDNNFDQNFIGIPTEGYGFSMDAKAFLGAPSFSEAAFALGDGGGTTTVTVVYW